MQLQTDDAAGSVWRIRLTAGGRDDVVITAAGLEQLLDTLARATDDDSCRALVLEGQPGCFCKGMDLDAVAGGDDADRGLQRYGDALVALRRSPKVIIVAVDGAVMAGGVGLAAVADILLATERSTFGLAEVMLGLLPGMVLPTLLERMTPQRVRKLALTAASIDASEAHRCGLVDKLVEGSDQLERAIRGELKNVLRTQPTAVAALKRLTVDIAAMSFDDAIEAGRQATRERIADADTRAAIEQFVAGEPLPWFARYRPGPST